MKYFLIRLISYGLYKNKIDTIRTCVMGPSFFGVSVYVCVISLHLWEFFMRFIKIWFFVLFYISCTLCVYEIYWHLYEIMWIWSPKMKSFTPSFGCRYQQKSVFSRIFFDFSTMKNVHFSSIFPLSIMFTFLNVEGKKSSIYTIEGILRQMSFVLFTRM